MDLNDVLQLPAELITLWHTHRTGLLVGAVLLFAALRFWLQRHASKRQNLLLESHIPVSPETKSPVRQISSPSEQDVKGTVGQFQPASKPNLRPKRVTGTKRVRSAREEHSFSCIQPVIFYFTLGGSTKAYAEAVASDFGANDDRILKPILHDLAQVDYDDFFVSPPRTSSGTAHAYLLLIPSYNIDTELSNFLAHLEETHNDFRIDTAPLSGLTGYSVFGIGDRTEWPTESEGYCSQSIETDRWMARLTGRKRAFPLGTGSVKHNLQERLAEWQDGVQNVLADIMNGRGLGEGVVGSGDAVESGDEDDEVEIIDDSLDSTRIRKVLVSKRGETGDLEDIRAPIPVDFTTAGRVQNAASTAPKPMVPSTSPTYTALTKQGYTIVGSHSGVKICRWTKSALRGRGSCYKFSFYGIQSHLCMEATPSLSCSNKCVFCWRHGTNPVGTTWRWQVDEPDLIFAGMKEGHYKKIKMMKGVPGVRAERFSEAMRIRHCALSLVGEPIFYPHINQLLAMLHREHISSFLVCNAQHPDQLAALGPVTQLYVSIDASNKDSLRRIDRPLHRDFWERFTRCMDILREKRFTHRTVFRLTLVKGFNLEEEAEGYADLVARALPAFVEIKGVTYCGTSTAAGAGLTMQNVPFYEEVTAFVLALEAALKTRGLEYGIGAEHAHSCCVLLADKARFFRSSRADGVKRWHTLIDYPAFFRCLESGEPFGPEDYVGAPTPEWALWGNGGFDPRDERVDRKGRPKIVAE